MKKQRVVIVGGGFAGLAAARGLRKSTDVTVTVIDKRNHHLFQPLLYQVAMAGLSPAEIAAPIRSMLSGQTNASVIQGEVRRVDCHNSRIVLAESDSRPEEVIDYDYLLLACGAEHSYFGNSDWEEHAPGLKTLEQATEIRRRVLSAFERAELETAPQRQKQLLTFVVVGGGPTGVEIAGAIGEMSRYTLARDFRRIESSLARIVLIEGGPRILPMFDSSLSSRAMRDLEQLGVQVWTSSIVTDVSADGVSVGDERLAAATVVWAAGVEAAQIGKTLSVPLDKVGRVIVRPDLSIEGFSKVFVAGDLAHFSEGEKPLPGVAPVAMQQGRHVAENILRDIAGGNRSDFHYVDKGKMATIGRSKAITQVGSRKIAGFTAWIVWLVVHIYYLTGFRNRLFVVMSWAWSYLTYRRGARLILEKEWRSSGPNE